MTLLTKPNPPGSPLRSLCPSPRPLRSAFLACSTLLLTLSATAQIPLTAAAPLGEDLFLRSGSTGMVMVVVRDKEVFFHGYGETAPGSGKAPTQDSFLRLCSLTKIFTTDLLTKLVEANTVTLDEPLQRLAPAHVIVPKRVQPITLGDLATHTSGLSRELGNAPHGTPHFTFPDHATRWRWLPDQHLHSVPGTAALYSNVAFDLLGDALQSAAQKPYPQLLADHTLKPLHMFHTTYFPTAAQCAVLLTSVHNDGQCTATENTAGSSGLYSTSTDMARFLKYLLGTGAPDIPAQSPAAQAVQILPATLLSQQGLDHAGAPTGVGLGWMHLLPPDDPSHIIEKTGGGAGFLTYIAMLPSRHTAVFFAATDGAIETHLNFFKAANDLLLTLAGLPPLPPDPPKPAPKPHPKRPIRHPH